MKNTSKLILGIVLVLAAVLIYINVSSRQRYSEEDKIHLMLNQMETAVERKDIGDVFSHISRDYSDSTGYKYDTLRMLALNAFRTNADYNLVLERPEIAVTGDKTKVGLNVSINSSLEDQEMREIFSGPLEIFMRKEKSHKWLFIPVSIWRIDSIDGLPTDYE